MIDIVSSPQGADLGIFDTQAPRAANILSIQVGSLEYAKDLGIDLKFFLSEDFRFQDQSFRAHLVDVLSRFGISVATIDVEVSALLTTYKFNLVPDDHDIGMFAR